MRYSEWIDPDYHDYSVHLFGILTEKTMLRITLKKNERRERESFLLRASLDTQGE